MSSASANRSHTVRKAICLASIAAISVVVALLLWKVWDAGVLEEPWFQLEPPNLQWYVSRVEEGRHGVTWTSDGATIVFGSPGRSGSDYLEGVYPGGVYLEGVYVVNAEGTQLTRWVPEGVPQDAEVEWGKAEFAYDATPHVNPVTSQIVYATLRYGGNLTKGRGLQIATAELDGSGYRRLTESDSTDLYPVWSPDGTRIAFVSNRGDRSFRVYIMDADGSNVVEAAPDGATRPERLLWSPDGLHLAYRRDGHLYIAPTVDEGAQGVGPPTTLDGLTWTDPAWSPDGEWLAFSDHESFGEAIEYETIYLVRPFFDAGPDGPASKKVIRLARVDGGSMHLDNLSWSPDGTALRFTAALGDNPYAYALHQVLTDGSGLTEIANVARRSRLTWSPDGSRVAVVHGRIGSSRDGLVYTMAPDGSDRRTIVVEGPYGPAAAKGR